MLPICHTLLPNRFGAYYQIHDVFPALGSSSTELFSIKRQRSIVDY